MKYRTLTDTSGNFRNPVSESGAERCEPAVSTVQFLTGWTRHVDDGPDDSVSRTGHSKHQLGTRHRCSIHQQARRLGGAGGHSQISGKYSSGKCQEKIGHFWPNITQISAIFGQILTTPHGNYITPMPYFFRSVALVLYVQGVPKMAPFLLYALTLPNIKLLTDFQNYFALRIRTKFVRILSLKIPPHLTLLCVNVSVLKATIENKTTSVTFHKVV